MLEWAINPLGAQPAPTYRVQFLTMVYMQFHTGLIIYAGTVAIANAIDSIGRLAQREAEAARLAGGNYRRLSWKRFDVNWSRTFYSIR